MNQPTPDEVLAKAKELSKIWLIEPPSSNEEWKDMGDSIQVAWLAVARHVLAAQSPAMTPERREELIDSAAGYFCVTHASAAKWLHKLKVILPDPAPQPTPGEIIRDIALKGDPCLAAGKIDEVVGPLVKHAEWCKEIHSYEHHAADALAPFEALMKGSVKP